MTDYVFVNTLPHAVTLRDADGNLTRVEPGDKALHDVFRGTSTSAAAEPMCAGGRSFEVSTRPTYTFDWAAFDALVCPEVPTAYLVSTISGDVIAANPDRARKPNARYYVPYTGPDQTLCKRNKGEIEWCARLMDYTPQ